MITLYRTPAQRYLVSDKELQECFYFADEAVLEFAPRELSQDKAFQDQFGYLAELLKDLEHPGVLRLLYWGMDNGRLYRAWEKRNLDGAICYLNRKPEYRRVRQERLVSLLDALETIWAKGLDLKSFVRRVGYDYGGLFVARLPLTMEYEIPSLGDRLMAQCEFFSTLPVDYPRMVDLCFLMELGCFCSLWLCGRYPVDRPATLSLPPHSMPYRKLVLDLEPELLAVIHRLMEIDPEKAYPSRKSGLQELKKALTG